MTLTALSMHLVHSRTFGQYGTNEMPYAKQLIDGIPALRSKTVGDACQEISGTLIAYNSIRMEIAKAALLVKIGTDRSERHPTFH